MNKALTTKARAIKLGRNMEDETMTAFQSTLDHPNARKLLLGEISQYRQALRRDPFSPDLKRMLKRAQRMLAELRQRR